MANKPGRPRAAKGKKGPTVGTGGHNRRRLEGKGPTPKAEDRKGHKAHKAKKLADKRKSSVRPVRKGEFVAAGPKTAGNQNRGRRLNRANENFEVLSGRNAVVEALRAKVPAVSLYLAQRIEMDDRVREAVKIANIRKIPVNEKTRAEIDRLTGFDSVHQGIALQVPPYSYSHPLELVDRALSRGDTPLLVALDGITDPRNLGAIIRSVAAFGAHGVILPQRRSTGVTAAAWKTSAGAAARVPVALAGNLNSTLKELKRRKLFVIGLDGEGDTALEKFKLADQPLVLVVGSEGKGLSRLVQENCDAIVAIPIAKETESLNAGIAASVALYEIAKNRPRF